MLVAAIIWLVASRRTEVAELLKEARLLLIAAALAASFGLIGLGAALWWLSLRMLGNPMPLRAILTASARSLPARYVPLGITYAVARVALLRAAGSATAPLAATAGLEMMVSVSVALTIGTALLGASGTLPGGLIWTVSAVVVGSAAASPAVGGRALTHVALRRGVDLRMTWSGYGQVLAASVAYWLWAAASFVLYLRAFPAADDFGTVETAGAFMVAWAVGFVTVLAPQGLGVAEVGLLALLSTEGGHGIAMATVFAGYRIVLFARDLLAAAAAEVIATRAVRQESELTG